MPKRISKHLHHQRQLTVYAIEAPVTPAGVPPAPCDVLSDEMLAYIFKHVADDDFLNIHSSTTLCANTVLSRVCHRWKRIINSYSTLWERLQLRLTPLSNPHNIYAIPAWLKNSGSRPLELVLDFSLDDVDSRVFYSWETAYYRLAVRRVDTDVTRNLAPHISRLTRLDLHLHESISSLVYATELWAVLKDAVNLRELTLAGTPNEYVIFYDTLECLSRIVSLSLRYFGFYLGIGEKVSIRKLVLNHEGTNTYPQAFEQIMTWTDVSLLTELHLYPQALEVLSSLEDLEAPFILPSLRTLHFYNFEARRLTKFLPIISAPEVEDFLVTGRQPFLDFVDFIAENDTYTFPKCTKLYLDADCEKIGLDRFDALGAAFPNVVELHIRGTLSEVVLRHMLSAKNRDTSSLAWPKLVFVSFACTKDNSSFYDQLFQFVEDRRKWEHPIPQLGYVCPNPRFAKEGDLQRLKKCVTLTRLPA